MRFNLHHTTEAKGMIPLNHKHNNIHPSNHTCILIGIGMNSQLDGHCMAEPLLTWWCVMRHKFESHKIFKTNCSHSIPVTVYVWKPEIWADPNAYKQYHKSRVKGGRTSDKGKISQIVRFQCPCEQGAIISCMGIVPARQAMAHILLVI
jgi:hypothetical protein